MASDEELFRQWQQGNENALETLVLRYQQKLYTILYNLVGSTHTAEDLVQETFIRLVREAQSYHYPRPFFPWLYKIARNLAYKHLQSAYHRHVELGTAIPEIAGQEFEPEEWMELQEEYRSLQAALQYLNFEQREVLNLRFAQSMSVKEIADSLGIPVGTVKSRTFQGLRRLRQYLDESSLQNTTERGDRAHG